MPRRHRAWRHTRCRPPLRLSERTWVHPGGMSSGRGRPGILGGRHRGARAACCCAARSKELQMATLVAISYPDEGTADEAKAVVQGLESQLIIQADQVAAISRDTDG